MKRLTVELTVSELTALVATIGPSVGELPETDPLYKAERVLDSALLAYEEGRA